MDNSAAFSSYLELPADVTSTAPDQPPPATLHELDLLVAVWPGLTYSQRRQLRWGIRVCAKAAATAKASRGKGTLSVVTDIPYALRQTPCDVGRLNPLIFSVPAKALGYADRSLENGQGGLRKAMRLAGFTVSGDDHTLAPDGAWTRLLAQLEETAQWRFGLTRFAVYCELRGIAPEQVTDAVLAAFDTFVRHNVLSESAGGLAETAAKAWRRARRAMPTWPAPAVRAPARRTPYVLPFTAYSPELQAAIAAIEARLLGGGRTRPFTRKGGFRPLKPSSVKSRMFSLRQALAGLVISGVRPEDIRTLADLVTPAAVEAILLHYWHRTIALRVGRGELAAMAEHQPADGVSSQTGAIAAVLMMIARHVVDMPEGDRSAVIALCRDLIPENTGRPSARNRARMRQFDEAAVLREALRVPAVLMQDARRLLACNPPHTARAAQRARLACALQVLFHIPIRIGNLCELRFGINLHTGDPRSGRINRLTLSAAETKSSADYEASVGPEVADMIAEWRTKFRSILAPPDSVYLFPSYPDRKEPLTIAAMREAIEIAMADEIGIQMHPHLFRHLMARIVLTKNPGAIEDVRLLLGDKTLSVVLASYVIVSQEQAGKSYDAALRAAMNAPPEATPKPARRRRRPAR